MNRLALAVCLLGLMTACSIQSKPSSEALQQEAAFSAAMEQTLAKMTQHQENTASHEKLKKAAHIFAKTDAAKAHAYTQLFAVVARHCGPEVQAKLDSFQVKASNSIELGRYYYTHGIEAKIDDQDFSQSGADLTAGLEKMVAEWDLEYQQASPEKLQKKCQEASGSLDMLAWSYQNF